MKRLLTVILTLILMPGCQKKSDALADPIDEYLQTLQNSDGK